MQALQITGTGAICAVGLDAATACASIHAGVSRPAPIVGLTSPNPGDAQDNLPVIGFPAAQLTDGFASTARWLQLAGPCLRDLCDSAALPAAEDERFWSTTALYLVTPYLDEERYDPRRRCSVAAIHHSFARPLQRSLFTRLRPRHVQVVPQGRAGVFHLVAQLPQLLKQHLCARALILAVDSWLDGGSLGYLMTLGRLKTSLNPVGLMPGEGAFAVLLEPEDARPARTGTARVWTGQVSVGTEADCYLANRHSMGRALTEQVAAVLPAVQGPLDRLAHVSDLNGEVWRASEWGHALVRLKGRGMDLGQAPQWIPATCLGDVGAGAGLLAMLVASHALARGHAPAAQVLLTLSDEHGDVGAMLVERNPNAQRMRT